MSCVACKLNSKVAWGIEVLMAVSMTFNDHTPSATVVSAEPFSHGTGTLRCLQKEMATYRH